MLSPLRSAALTATGELPTGKSVRGNELALKLDSEVEVIAGVKPLGVILAESRASVIGNRSPTKNIAGFPSSARNSMRRPLLTTDNVSERSALILGSTANIVVLPPPKAISGGIAAPSPPAVVPNNVCNN